jgi:hypothetical protein
MFLFGLLFLGMLVATPHANGGIIIKVNQVGSNVVTHGSGTIDLTGLTPLSSSGGSPGLNGFISGYGTFLTVGATGNVNFTSAVSSVR